MQKERLAECARPNINEAVRKAFAVKKITSSHSKGKTEILTEAPMDDNKPKSILEATVYKVLGIHTEPYKEKGFSLFKRK